MTTLEEQIISEMDMFLVKVSSKLREDAQLRKEMAEEMGKRVRKT